MLDFPVTRSGRVQNSQKSQRKKKFYATFSLAVFLFPVKKRAEKISGFVYIRKGTGKM